MWCGPEWSSSGVAALSRGERLPAGTAGPVTRKCLRRGTCVKMGVLACDQGCDSHVETRPAGPASGGTNWPRTSASATAGPRSPLGAPACRGKSARAATTPRAARATAAVENNQARRRSPMEGSGLWKEDWTTLTLGPAAAPAALERPPSSGRARKRVCASTRHGKVTAPRVQTQTTPATSALAPSALGTAVGGGRSLSFSFLFFLSSDFALACTEPVIA